MLSRDITREISDHPTDRLSKSRLSGPKTAPKPLFRRFGSRLGLWPCTVPDFRARTALLGIPLAKPSRRIVSTICALAERVLRHDLPGGCIVLNRLCVSRCRLFRRATMVNVEPGIEQPLATRRGRATLGARSSDRDRAATDGDRQLEPGREPQTTRRGTRRGTHRPPPF